MIIAQQPTEALSTHHQPILMLHAGLWDNELVPQPLMISLVMVMRQVRLDHRVERRLSDHDHLIQGLLFDRAHESFAMGIEIRTPWWQGDGLHSTRAKHLVEAMHKFRVAIVE